MKNFKLVLKSRLLIHTGCYPDLDNKFVKFTYSNNLGTLKFEPKGTDTEFLANREDIIVFMQDQIF